MQSSKFLFVCVSCWRRSSEPRAPLMPRVLFLLLMSMCTEHEEQEVTGWTYSRHVKHVQVVSFIMTAHLVASNNWFNKMSHCKLNIQTAGGSHFQFSHYLVQDYSEYVCRPVHLAHYSCTCISCYVNWRYLMTHYVTWNYSSVYSAKPERSNLQVILNAASPEQLLWMWLHFDALTQLITETVHHIHWTFDLWPQL